MKGRANSVRKAAQGRGALVTLALLFLLSGALRVIDGAATAATDAGSGQDYVPTSAAHAPPRARGADEAAALTEAMAELKRREERVLEAEQRLADRMRALEVAEATADQKLRELSAAEERLRATMASAQSAAENDIAQLTSVYENMKPKEASEVFARMSPEFAAGFLGRMRADVAAQILSALDPEKAYSISLLLAARNANVPKQ